MALDTFSQLSLLPIDDIKKLIYEITGFDKMYDLGHVIPTANPNFNPNGIYPGKWELLPEGTVLIAGVKNNGDNTFIVKQDNIKQFNTSENTHSHTTQNIEDGIAWQGGPSGGFGIKSENVRYSGNNTHSHAIGADKPTAIDLSTILKHDRDFYFWIRTE